MKVTARRVLTEKRAIVLPLAIALVANIAVAALFVYPMTLRSRDLHARAAASEDALGAAEREFKDAQGIKARKERANDELQRFYKEVLPVDLAGARGMTYLKLAQLARKHNLRSEHRNASPETDHDSQLGRLKMTMTLQGEYDNVRRFIHDLETAPEFVVIDDISLTLGTETSSPLVLTLELSTYYRLGANGD